MIQNPMPNGTGSVSIAIWKGTYIDIPNGTGSLSIAIWKGTYIDMINEHGEGTTELLNGSWNVDAHVMTISISSPLYM